MPFKMLFLVLTLVLIPTIFVGAEFNDTPHTNFVQQMTDEPGECVNISAYKVHPDKMYEGRWYAVFIGVLPSQALTMSCYYFDSFFDKQGDLHHFTYFNESGEPIVAYITCPPVNKSIGLYGYDVGIGKLDNIQVVMYYVDNEMIIRWYSECLGDVTRRGALIGFRNVKDVPRKMRTVRWLLRRLRHEAGPFDVRELGLHNCHYPPPMKNPYA